MSRGDVPALMSSGLLHRMKLRLIDQQAELDEMDAELLIRPHNVPLRLKKAAANHSYWYELYLLTRFWQLYERYLRCGRLPDPRRQVEPEVVEPQSYGSFNAWFAVDCRREGCNCRDQTVLGLTVRGVSTE